VLRRAGLRDPADGGAEGRSAIRTPRPDVNAQGRRGGAVRGEASPVRAAHQSLGERTHTRDGTEPPPPSANEFPAAFCRCERHDAAGILSRRTADRLPVAVVALRDSCFADQ